MSGLIWKLFSFTNVATARYILLLLGMCSLFISCSTNNYIVLENETPKTMTVLARALDPNVPTVFVCRHPNVLDPSALIDTVINNEHWMRCYLESGDEMYIGRVNSMEKVSFASFNTSFDSLFNVEYVDTNSMFYSQLVIEYDSTGYTENMKNNTGGIVIPEHYLTIPTNVTVPSDSEMRARGYAVHPPGRSIFPTRNAMRLIVWPTKNLFGRKSGWKMYYMPEMYQRGQ
jgi:hypothetical protein